jgi:hypothetical protein
VRVVVVQLVLAFFLVTLSLVLIFWVLVALLEGVITPWSVHGAGLECLVAAIRRNLFFLFLHPFVVVWPTIAVLPLVILMMIHLVRSTIPAIACAMMFCNMIYFFPVPLLKHVEKLALFARYSIWRS